MRQDDEDEEEHFTDVKLDDEEEVKDEEGGLETCLDPAVESENKETEVVKEEETHATNKASWTFRTSNKNNPDSTYSIQARNPLYSGAEYTCAWELVPMVNHFHPSAQHFAGSVLKVRFNSLFFTANSILLKVLAGEIF